MEMTEFNIGITQVQTLSTDEFMKCYEADLESITNSVIIPPEVVSS